MLKAAPRSVGRGRSSCGAAPAPPPRARPSGRRRCSTSSPGASSRTPSYSSRASRITAVGPGLAIPRGAEVFDLGDVTILPGLIDCHTHVTTTYRFLLEGGPMQDAVTSAARAKLTLDAGFTTVRDLWAKDFTDVALRDAIERGEVEGPRMLVATLAIGSTGGHNEDVEGLSPTITVGGESGIADGVDGVRKLARYEIKYGADVLKIMATEGGSEGRNVPNETQFTLEEMKAIVEEGHRYGKKVAAHAHGTDGIKTAIRAGVDSVEHGTLLDDEGVRMLKEKGVFLVPTGAIWVEGRGSREGGRPGLAQGARGGLPARQRGGVPQGRRRRGEDRDGLGLLRPAARREREGDRLDGDARHDAARGDPRRDGQRGGASGLVGSRRLDRPGQVRRHHRRPRQPAPGRDDSRARGLGDEGRRRHRRTPSGSRR